MNIVMPYCWKKKILGIQPLNASGICWALLVKLGLKSWKIGLASSNFVLKNQEDS